MELSVEEKAYLWLIGKCVSFILKGMEKCVSFILIEKCLRTSIISIGNARATNFHCFITRPYLVLMESLLYNHLL